MPSVRRRNPSRVINERRRQRIIGALVNLRVEDKPLSAFDSFVVGKTTRKRPTIPGRSERAWCCQSLTPLPGLERVGPLFSHPAKRDRGLYSFARYRGLT